MSNPIQANTKQLSIYSEVILINENASVRALGDDIDRKIEQAQGITHLLCGIDLSRDGGALADNCVSNAAWGLTETLAEIGTLVDQICKLEFEHPDKPTAKST